MKFTAEGISRVYIRSGHTGSTNMLRALEETDFELPEGALTVIVGRSGSGKSTFSGILSGLLKPTHGRVLAGGEDLYAMGDEKLSRFRNLHIGVMPQGRSCLQNLTVMENVLLPAAMYGNLSGKEERAEALLRRMGIEKLMDVGAGELSGGEMRRMSAARALIMEPDFVAADEPTGDLDDDSTERVMELLKETAEGGASVLMVTHDASALPYASYIYRMENGVLTRQK